MDSSVTNQQGVFLILHGVDTVAAIQLNGVLLGHTDNMFVRYRFDVRNLLKASVKYQIHFTYMLSDKKSQQSTQHLDHIQTETVRDVKKKSF